MIVDPKASLPEERLFAAVIGLALRDSCLKPLRSHGKELMHEDAYSAHSFLWTDAAEAYLHWLDIDADQFRSRIKQIMKDDSAISICGFNSEERRFFRFNQRLWERQWLTTPKDA